MKSKFLLLQAIALALFLAYGKANAQDVGIIGKVQEHTSPHLFAELYVPPVVNGAVSPNFSIYIDVTEGIKGAKPYNGSVILESIGAAAENTGNKVAPVDVVNGFAAINLVVKGYIVDEITVRLFGASQERPLILERKIPLVFDKDIEIVSLGMDKQGNKRFEVKATSIGGKEVKEAVLYLRGGLGGPIGDIPVGGFLTRDIEGKYTFSVPAKSGGSIQVNGLHSVSAVLSVTNDQ